VGVYNFSQEWKAAKSKTKEQMNIRLETMNEQKVFGSPTLPYFMYVSAATFKLRKSDFDPYALIVKNSISTGRLIPTTFITDI
jgi:hypothetical protein